MLQVFETKNGSKEEGKPNNSKHATKPHAKRDLVRATHGRAQTDTHLLVMAYASNIIMPGYNLALSWKVPCMPCRKKGPHGKHAMVTSSRRAA